MCVGEGRVMVMLGCVCRSVGALMRFVWGHQSCLNITTRLLP